MIFLIFLAHFYTKKHRPNFSEISIFESKILTHFLAQFCTFWAQICQKTSILFLAQTEVYPSKYFSSAGKKRCYTLTVALFSGQLLFLSDVLSPAVNVSFKFKSKWPRIKVCQLRRHHLLLRHNYRFLPSRDPK